jgi:HK97 gp10 family phage protein
MAELATVKGLQELGEALRALGEEVQRGGGPLKRALRAGAMLLVEDAQARAPVDKGNLRISIRAVRDSNPRARGRTEAYFIGARRGKAPRDRRRGKKKDVPWTLTPGTAYYAPFIEFGVPVHGRPARPFLRPAFEATREKILALFKAHLAADIAKIAARQARRSAALRRGG